MADEAAPRQGKRETERVEDRAERTERNERTEKTEELSQQAQAERSLTGKDEPLVVKTVLVGLNTDDDEAVGAKIVRSDEGEEIEAANGLPYQGVSENWVKLAPKD